MSKGSTGGSRPISEEERKLLDQQSEYLGKMGDIAEKEYGLSTEDRDYYTKVFREGTDTEAKAAIAKLRSQITGETIKPEDITNTNLDSVLRDLTLNGTTELKDATNRYVSVANEALKTYGDKATGLASNFTKGLQDYSNKYSEEIAKTKSEMGTINKDILARETGASQAGISSSYAEARKQVESDLARRGLSNSGVGVSALTNTYQQEAMAKANAGAVARASALNLSDQQRQNQLNLAGQEYQTGVAGLQTNYQTEQSNLANIYGLNSQQIAQNYNLSNQASQQGIANLQSISAMGSGIQASSANYLQGASGLYSNIANSAGSSAQYIGNAQTQYTNSQQQAQAQQQAGLYGAIGTIAGASIGFMASGGNPYVTTAGASAGGSVGRSASDFRFKNNITYIKTVNGIRFYTWEWNTLAKEYLGEHKLYEPYGVIAQELRQTNPELVFEDDNGYLFVDYTSLEEK